MAITLLEMLLKAGLLTPAQCDEALQNRVFFGGRIGTNLIELDFIHEEDLARFLSRKLAVPYVDPKELLNLPPRVIELIPPEIALQYQVVPLRLDQRRLTIATADPSALTAIDEIAFITGKIIIPMITPEVRLVQALGKYYHFGIDERYQSIIDRIDSRRQATAGTVAEQEPTFDHQKSTAAPTTAADDAQPEPWKVRFERYSIDQTSRSLAHAEDPGEIGDTLIRFLGERFDRAALFLVRTEAICGWRAVQHGKGRESFREVRIPLQDASILTTVVNQKMPYIGPLTAPPFSPYLQEVLGGESADDAMLVPVMVGNRTVVILQAGDRKEKLQEQGPELKRLAAKAALAFEILIAREKILIS